MNILIGVVIVVAVLAIVLIVRVFELSDKLSEKEFDPIDDKGNKMNAILMMVFLIVASIGLYLVTDAYNERSLYALPPASEHGAIIDSLYNTTLLVTGLVFVFFNVMLFYFAYRYRHKRGEKAKFQTHNDKLEIWWTIIPAIVMIYLAINGGMVWNSVLMTDPPEDAYLVEVTGKQFAWQIRYPGADGKLGKTDHKLRTPENELGLDLSDPAAQDDIIIGAAAGFYLPVNKYVLFKINALDVLHAVYVPHFRVKLDAVPGMQTQFGFIPTITTAEMREQIGNEDFNYEMACAELCGKSHFAMKGVVYIDSQEEVDSWLSKQKTYSEKMKEKQMAIKAQ